MWSSEILDELSRAVTRVRPGIDPEAVDRRIQAMDDFFPDAKVLSAAWRPLVEGLDLPDPDDRHILAAAIAGGAQCIVTRNINHFPASCLASYSIEAVTPDAFLLDRFDQRPHDVLHTLRQQAADTAHPR